MNPRDRMKRGRILYVISVFIMLASLAMSGTANGSTTIDYTDPSGDVDNDGLGSEGVEDADIISLSLDHGSDPIVIELTVSGKICLESSTMMYAYEIQIDHSGGKNEETTLDIANYYPSSFSSDYGSDQVLTSQLSGNGTSTLRIEIPSSWLTGSPGFSDIFAETLISSSNFMNSAEDDINKDFQGGGGAGDDDDDTPAELYLPPGEDPDQATPTDPSLAIDIAEFDSTFTVDDTNYELIQQSTGTGSSSIDKCAYALVYYPKNGNPSVSWKTGPVDTTQSSGGMSYEERFKGKTADDAWDSWEWYFKSTGPSDTSEVQKYKEDSGYWNTIDRVVLFVRVFDDTGAWNQDSMDVTDKFNVQDNTGDDDADDDDTGDDDTDDDDDGGSDKKTPGPGIPIIAGGIILTVMIGSILMRRKR
jgi:hypothetical protein